MKANHKRSNHKKSTQSQPVVIDLSGAQSPEPVATHFVIDLTGVQSPEPVATHLKSKPGQDEAIVIADVQDPDICYVRPQDYSPAKKKQKLKATLQEKFNVEKSTESDNCEIDVVFFNPGLKFPHAREHCTANKFLKGFASNNAVYVSKNQVFCEQCYCFICEIVASECKSWSTGLKPHCNSYAKNVVWETIKRTIKVKAAKDGKTVEIRDFCKKAYIEVAFKVNPTPETYKTMKEAISEKEWDRCKARCCDYVSRNSKKLGVEKCLDAFYQLESFNEMKAFVTNIKCGDKTFEQFTVMFDESCKTSREKGLTFIAAFQPWLGQLLFISFRLQKPMPQRTIDLFTKVAAFDKTVLNAILVEAMKYFEQYLDKVTCSAYKRELAKNWLVEVKNMSKEWGELTEFSRLYHKLLNGTLKRKGTLIAELSKCGTRDVISKKDLAKMDKDAETVPPKLTS